MAEIETVLKSNGIGTYVVVFKDPDSENEASLFDGSYAWVYGHLSFVADLIKHRYNADRYGKTS